MGISTRTAIARHLQQNPSLKSRIPDALEEGFAVGVDLALRETDLPIRAFPASCPYEWSLIMSDGFLCDTSQDWE